jgi:hypothetical protein
LYASGFRRNSGALLKVLNRSKSTIKNFLWVCQTLLATPFVSVSQNMFDFLIIQDLVQVLKNLIIGGKDPHKKATIKYLKALDTYPSHL